MKALEDGSVKVFDTATFTVNGETVTTYLAGVFLVSFFRSAPFLDLVLDFFTNLDA